MLKRMQTEAPVDLAPIEQFEVSSGFTDQGLEKVNRILGFLIDSLNNDVEIKASLFQNIVEIHEKVGISRENDEQKHFLGRYFEFERKSCELLSLWHRFSKSHQETQPEVDEICLTSIVLSCKNLLFIKKKYTNTQDLSVTYPDLKAWNAVCFDYLSFFSKELGTELKETFPGHLAAFIATYVFQLCELCHDFAEVKLAYTVLNRILVLNGKDPDFLKSFNLVQVALCISAKMKEIIEYNTLLMTNLTHKSTDPNANFENLSFFGFYFCTLLILTKNCSEKIKTLASVDGFELDYTEFLYNMLYINGCLHSQQLNPNLSLQGSIASIHKFNKYIFSTEEVSPRLLSRVFKNLGDSQLNTQDPFFLLGKFYLLSSILNSLTSQSNDLKLLFTPSSDNSSICLLEELTSALSKMPPTVWLTPGLALLTNISGAVQNEPHSVYSMTVQNLTYSACILQGQFDVWEKMIIKQFLSSNSLFFLCICEAWSHVWCYLPYAVQKSQLESIAYLQYYSQPCGQLSFRTSTLVARFAESFTTELLVDCSNKLLAAANGFVDNPMLLFSLCMVYPLGKFKSDTLTKAASVIVQNFKSILACPNLILPTLLSLKELFKLAPTDNFLAPHSSRHITMFLRHVLISNCSSDENGSGDPKLVVAAYELISVAPLSLLEPVAIEVCLFVTH
ncbi:hypothetical protein DSO57_1013296 [Entomophthora muscae]|uniref:Uncharacterized protein n=1 Tax=Entomophthora muscae TaxID=34485 RepID=A0ACC2SUX8_9FUNG|nr:hypothetical protein DSO57_1013296 [Entomophthora muscae]